MVQQRRVRLRGPAAITRGQDGGSPGSDQLTDRTKAGGHSLNDLRGSVTPRPPSG